jgi:2-hydroxychromene-2-carboxylate isomerase
MLGQDRIGRAVAIGGRAGRAPQRLGGGDKCHAGAGTPRHAGSDVTLKNLHQARRAAHAVPACADNRPTMIECFFDCSSPWTWLAFRKLRTLAAELGVPVHWRPVLVGGIFNAVNPSVYAFRENGPPAKQAYLKKDLLDWARHDGVTILFPPSVFPVNSVKAMRACCWVNATLGAAAMENFAEAVFHAYWTLDQDIAQDAVLAAVCAQQGLDAAAVLAAIATPEVKAQLKANTDEVIARGGFGSPTLFVGGDDMYFGNDRLPLVREAVLRRLGRA